MKTMRYAKPEVVLSGSALASIQGSLNKQDVLQETHTGYGGEFNESINAYESDE